VASSLPLAIRVPSGLNATLLTPPLCPLSIIVSCPQRVAERRRERTGSPDVQQVAAAHSTTERFSAAEKAQHNAPIRYGQ
jgi:hypothetical protein